MQNNSNKTYSKLKAYSALSFLIQCAFFLGKIIEIEDDGVDFMDIGTDGERDDDIHLISYRDITQVEFEDNYSKTLYKYVCKQIN